MEKEKLTDAQLEKISAELDKTEQALTLPNKQIGEMIVNQAKTVHDEERRNKVINEVKRLMQCSDESKVAIDLYTKSLAWYEKKLKAIQAGEFELTLKGEIFPHDEDLRRGNY